MAVDSRLCRLIDIGQLASAAWDAWLGYIVRVGLELAGEETISSWFPTQRVKERGPRRSMGMGPLYGRWTVRTCAQSAAEMTAGGMASIHLDVNQ